MIYGLLCKRTVKKSVHKKDHNYDSIIKNWFLNNGFIYVLIEYVDTLSCGKFQCVVHAAMGPG